MGDVDMSDAGGVAVQLPTDTLQKNSFFTTPTLHSQIDADLYLKLKKLQRDLEFLTLQEVRLSHVLSNFRNISKTNKEV